MSAVPLWQLPGPVSWVRELTAAAIEGAGVVACMPSPQLPGAFTSAIAEHLDVNQPHHDLRMVAVDADGKKPCGAQIIQASGVDWYDWKPISAEQVAEHPATTDLFFFIDVRHSPVHVQRQWCQWAEEIGRAARNQPSMARPATLVAACPGSGLSLPVTDVHIAVSWWWGVVGPVDAAVYHHALSHRNSVEVAQEEERVRWALGAWDVDACRTVSPTDLNELHGQPAPATPSSDPALLAAWSAGQVNAWNGRLDAHFEIADDGPRRLWFAHLRILFPWLEHVRLDIARHLADVGGLVPDEVEAMELKELIDLKKERRLYRKMEREAEQLLDASRNARNDIAHLRPVRPETLERLAKLANESSVVGQSL